MVGPSTSLTVAAVLLSVSDPNDLSTANLLSTITNERLRVLLRMYLMPQRRGSECGAARPRRTGGELGRLPAVIRSLKLERETFQVAYGWSASSTRPGAVPGADALKKLDDRAPKRILPAPIFTRCSAARMGANT